MHIHTLHCTVSRLSLGNNPSFKNKSSERNNFVAFNKARQELGSGSPVQRRVPEGFFCESRPVSTFAIDFAMDGGANGRNDIHKGVK